MTFRPIPRPVRQFLFLLFLVLFLSAPAGSPRAGIFDPQTFTLSNGIQVVVITNRRVPVVTHMIWYKAGSADEISGKSGAAHLLEHLMFKGTKKWGPGEFSRILARNGGQENAFTSYDYTGYYQTVAADRLEMVMEMEADRMTNLVLTPELMEPERSVVLEERRQRTDNNPSGILREQIQAAQYLNHPYGRPVIGWEHEVKGLTLDDILDYYRRWYTPRNAVLVVAGDITAEQLRPLAEKYYGVIPAGSEAKRARPQEPPQRAARQVMLEDERVREPSWSRAYLAPSYSSGDSRYAYALEVAAEILAGGATSRLYRFLVVDQQLMTSAGAYYSPDGLGPSRFVFYASPRPGISMQAVEDAVELLITNLLAQGVTEEEVSKAKNRMEAEAIYARDSFRTGAQLMGAALTSNRTVEDVESWPERISAVSKGDVDEAMRAVLDEKRSVTGLLLPAKAK